MSALPLRTLFPCVRISPLTPAIGGLLPVGCQPPLPLSPFPATLARPVKHKSFICNAYKKHGRVGGCQWDSQSWLSVSLGLWPSTFNLQPLPPVTTHQSPVTSHLK
jgi:hypothetical protein